MSRNSSFLVSGIVGLLSLTMVLSWLFLMQDSISALGGQLKEDSTSSLARLQGEFATLKPGTTTSKPSEALRLDEDRVRALQELLARGESSSLPENEDAKKPYAQVKDPAKNFCTRGGGLYNERSSATGDRYGVCVFADGTECEAMAFQRGECHIGQYSKAEQNMKASPDLSLEVRRANYCNVLGSTISWVYPESAKRICFDGITVHNNGSLGSASTLVQLGSERIIIPALSKGGSYTLAKPLHITRSSVSGSAVLHVDPSNDVAESNETNNSYIFLITQ